MTASYRPSAAAYYLRAWAANSGHLLWELAVPGAAPARTLAQAAEQNAAPSADVQVRTGTRWLRSHGGRLCDADQSAGDAVLPCGRPLMV